MTIKECIKWATKELENSCERSQYEAELLLAYLLNRDRVYLITHDKEPVVELDKYMTLVQRRKNNEPYEYIVEKASFYDIELEVKDGVLIPRPETEILIDLVSEIIKKENIKNIAEIGVGSGAISIVLARKFPSLNIVATDICDTPLEVSKKNVEKFSLASQIKLIKSNLIDEVYNELELVVSNPPYIAENFLLESHVVDYEPKEALFGGYVGDELLKQIIIDVNKRGIKYLACEMGYDQKKPIEAFVKDFEVEYIKFYKDLAGLDRGFVIKFK
ncbi:Protein-N(5)-glutamine methyltransferase PrmC, methylates polypeptide chain release factors RF1 and RF2 [hydrothermal vent metagenome]|uniref:peptide chain release factor N(5)-glutamine methyltransferase n=1 Tax=hydrothermal vent metagenome TaxID=652676 RepID=A0A1W1EEA6_9ZZZZ